MKKLLLVLLISGFTNSVSADCEDWVITDKRANFFRDATPKIIIDCIDSGSDPNYRDEFGQTPLHMLGWVDNADLVDILVGFGADINRQDYEGWTPLHVAARYGYNSSVIEALIELGADRTIRDNSGKLPWHYAQINRENLEGTDGWRQLQKPRDEVGPVLGRIEAARLEAALAEATAKQEASQRVGEDRLEKALANAARLRQKLDLARKRLAEAREELQLRRGVPVRGETGPADSVDRALFEAAETRVMQLAVENTRLRDRLADLDAIERDSEDRIAALRRRIDEQIDRLAYLRTQAEKAEAESRLAKAQVARLAANIRALKEQVKRLNAALEASEAK